MSEFGRVVVPALDEILGRKFQVLDDGFVYVVDYMGGDESIVQAARCSYGRGTKKVSDDEGLIRYLMRHKHTTPFEMCEIKLHVRVPMDTWRQWIRHRQSSTNEYSTRYSEAIDSCQKTPQDKWRLQATNNKQGSAGYITGWMPQEEPSIIGSDFLVGSEENHALLVGEHLSECESNLQKISRNVYEERLKFGVAREQARKDLPLSTYTEAYWKIDLHNLLHFLALRMDAHAQEEIRSYANVIGNEIVARWTPITWAAFNDYHPMRNAVVFSAREKVVLKAIVGGKQVEAKQAAQGWGWLERNSKGVLKTNRERQECEAKLAALGLSIDWEWIL